LPLIRLKPPKAALNEKRLAMARKYFGTDGIRGRANSTPLTPDFAMKVGQAAGIASSAATTATGC
jgi:phosphomannomutase